MSGENKDTVLLEVRNLSVEFPGVKALDGVSLSVGAGECHALLGENGAGKSTLAKCLIGENHPSAGEILIGGTTVSRHFDVRESQQYGIAIVHQEFQLMEELTALENIFVGRYEKKGPFIDRKRQDTLAQELLERLGITLPLYTPVKYLRTAEKQLVQLARALAHDAKVIILDELTAVLPEHDVATIFSVVRQLKAEGRGIVYISHRLDEVFELCDTYTVLMDGRHIESGEVATLTKSKLVRLIAGRELNQVFPELPSPLDEVILEVRGLEATAFHDIDLYVRRGEVVGIAGLVGAGKSELLRALFGDEPLKAGSILINGEQVRIKNPRDAIKHRIGFVPDERKLLGLNDALDVRKNTTVASMNQFRRGPFLDDSAELRAAYDVLSEFKLRYTSLWQATTKLSGGNQQKIVLAKWVLADTEIFLMDEPTRGIDVGAKSEIYRLIARLVSEGKSVILVSPEIEELLGLAHRIYVLYEGRLRDVVDGERRNTAEIMTSMLGAE